MRHVITLFLATVLVAGCGDEKKPNPTAPEPEPKQIPGEKKKGAPGVTHLLLLSDAQPT